MRQSISAPLADPERMRLDKRLAQWRTRVGTAAFDAALAEGERLTTDQAVALARGVAAVGSDVTAQVADVLTTREREIAALVARGMTNPQIARELVIGDRTVQSHVGSILAKLGLSSRVQIAAWTIERQT
jgi:non-specific serine/threonine protein kinase